MAWLTVAEARAMTEEQRLDYITRTILGEAVGEGYVGMVVVGQVIANRAGDSRFPSDPVAVAGQSWQFSTNSPGTGGNQGMVSANYGPGTREYRMAKAAAQATIYDKSVPDLTGGSVQYHTISMGWPESWPTSIQRYGHIDIGNHRVYPAHPVPPNSIPNVSSISYVEGVGIVSAKKSAPPIRPATLSAGLSLQRELNRVAQSKANAPAIIRRNRAFAFDTVIDKFEAPLVSDGRGMVINRPIPAMRESMKSLFRATGTPSTTERVFALQEQRAQLGDAMVSRPKSQPPVLVVSPMGVRQSVAAGVAATDADNGRGQLIMVGNPNISGSVVDWLYPRIVEGQGEANQVGKGPRMPGQSLIERGNPVVMKPGQSTIERGGAVKLNPGQSVIERGPRVVLTSKGATVIPQSQIERSTANLIGDTFKRAAAASDPGLSISLAASIASKQQARLAADDTRLMRSANELRGGDTIVRLLPALPGGTTLSKAGITPQSTRQAADTRLLRDANEVRGGQTVATIPTRAIPGPPPAVGKTPDRLPSSSPYPPSPTGGVQMSHPGDMPSFGSLGVTFPRLNAVGTMPSFGDLAALRPQIPGQSQIERGAPITLGQPRTAPVPATRPTTQAPAPLPPTARPSAATLPNTRPTTVAPAAARPPAPVDRPVTSGPINKTAVGGAVKGGAGRVVRSFDPATGKFGSKTLTRAPAPAATPTTPLSRETNIPDGYVDIGNGSIQDTQYGGVYHLRNLNL